MRVAVGQTPGTGLHQWQELLPLLTQHVQTAHAGRAELLVLPECFWPAYCLGSADDYHAARRNGLPAPDWFIEQLRICAREHQIALCAGFVEEHNGTLCNAACLVDLNGTVAGVHRKCFLWDFDHDYYAPGGEIRPFDTSLGRIGVMICADARPPEIAATLVRKGAELIVQPTAWVNAASAEAPWNPQPDFLIAARAAELGVPVASASKYGREQTTTFVGQSVVCDGCGQVAARCGGQVTEVAIGDVTLAPLHPPELRESERELLMAQRTPVHVRADVPSVQTRAHYFGDVLSLDLQAGEQHLRLEGPADVLLALEGVLLAAVPAALLDGFGAARCLALEGVHGIVAWGASDATATLRARACENRLFVIGCGPEGWCVIDPRGLVLHASTWGVDTDGVAVDVEFKHAASKYVAPRTDMLANRRPQLYQI